MMSRNNVMMSRNTFPGCGCNSCLGGKSRGILVEQESSTTVKGQISVSTRASFRIGGFLAFSHVRFDGDFWSLYVGQLGSYNSRVLHFKV
jgi:hypothetical protein